MKLTDSNTRFQDYEGGPDFERARSMIATPYLYVDIPLDTLTANAIYPISGDFLYCDPASTGIVTLEFNNQYADKEAPFQVSSGFIARTIFKQLKLSWAAQPGKIVRLIYSTGALIVPAPAITLTGSVTVTNVNSAFSHTAPAVTAASTQFLAANANRRYLMIQNTDAALTIWARADGGAVAGNSPGIKIPPGGYWEPASPPSGAVLLISPGGNNNNVTIVEG